MVVDLRKKSVACNACIACFLCHVQHINIRGYLLARLYLVIFR